jgi:Darcynin, domain of unknown function
MTTPTVPCCYTIFMLVKTTNVWLALSPPERFAFLDADINPILQAHPLVKMRFFDAEAFNSRVTDVMFWETSDLSQYSSVVEGLRESRFWGTYFEVVEIIPGVENGYAKHYQMTPMGRNPV